MSCSICSALDPLLCPIVLNSFSPAVLSLLAVCRSNGTTDLMHLGCVPQVSVTIKHASRLRI